MLSRSVRCRRLKLLRVSLRQPRAGLATLSIRDDRIGLWTQELERQQAAQEQATQDALARAEPLELAVQSPTGDNFAFSGVAGASTSIDVLKQMHELGLPKFQALATKNEDTGELLDLRTPLQRSGTLQLLDFSSDEGKSVFWHSSAHVLGQALENKFQDKIRLTDGPSLKEGGFFYEMFLQDGLTVSETDFDELSRSIKKIVKARQPFERLQVTREFADELFAYSDFKRDMLHKIPEGEIISLYRCGPLIDLCRGPHVPHTGMLSSFEITRCGASHWEGKELLQRVYAISFPNNAQLKEWRHLQEEAKKRDHRLIGRAQQLFMFHPLSPGSSFFLPHGTRVFNTLADFIRGEYRRRGYDEVITPLIFKKELWETSGHLKNYHDDMFMVSQGIAPDDACEGHDHDHAHGEEEYDQFGLKPMNCPGHCLVFREAKKYSYRELPVRLADFSALHRNEASGALTGLTRVRRFHQDDAHIFCTAAQVQSEISHALDFIKHVYGIFDFEFNLRLSTRPEKYMGELELWDDAEDQLRLALDDFGQPWTVNEGDGAFYGPKIDIVVTDALKRKHQCGTIQLDFQLPINFELEYDGADGEAHTPIIIHRAVLGSIERMMAILIEHTGGKWPLWLSPRQVAVLPIAEAHREYAHEVASKLQNATSRGLFVDVQDGSKTLNKRVREAQVAGYNYILVVGDKEQASGEVNIRTRDNQVHGAKPLSDFIDDIKAAIDRLE
ncbi:putative threonine--tRNA ligase 1, cytoplasmic [Phytophthora idaei]|nr:putative threonine--tRNA ligase 1, cytoplasmic [Phytophthora idaei]KAG3165029.1 putative threonine--tRNA ligase 1, cytoplasmic [Phytophthora idaei]KAG3250513.1 putative threonine--tRNA ligase 1, cytoplasmic [Phytophthora idaei]